MSEVFTVSDIDTDGNIIVRNMTEEETAQKQADRLTIEQLAASVEERASKKAALLQRLNITEEDLSILGVL